MQHGRRLAIVALALALVGGVARGEVVNRIIATVDGEPITKREFDRYAQERQALALPEKEMLESLITDKLLQKEASALGIAVKDEEVDGYIAQVKERNHLTDAQFAEAIAGQGLTIPQYRERIRTEIQKSMLVNREVRGRVTVTNEDVQRYYNDHLDEYASADGMVVRDIMVRIDATDDADAVAAKQARAEALRERVKKGESFPKVAEEASEGPGRENGGLLGTFKKGELAPELEKAIRGLKPGDTSEVVRMGNAFHILHLDSVASGGHRALADVQDEIREQLYGKDLQQRFDQWMSKDLRERHAVEVFN